MLTMIIYICGSATLIHEMALLVYLIIKVFSTISLWPQFFRTEAPVEWMMYLILGSLVTRICRIGGVLVNDLKLDFWLSLESMSSSHGNVY